VLEPVEPLLATAELPAPTAAADAADVAEALAEPEAEAEEVLVGSHPAKATPASTAPTQRPNFRMWVNF
jgi:hypothetical protein